MPTYDYQCDGCGESFEVFQSIKARPLRKAECPNCATVRPVRRLIGTGAAVLFKGSGFYQTDYRSAAYKKAVKTESDSKPKPSTDSKTAPANADAPSEGKTKTAEVA